MTKRRPGPGSAAAGKGSGPRRQPLPPAFPDPAGLEGLAAAEAPSPQGAWWTSLQVTEHVLASVSHADPLTGEPLPQSLQELLVAMNGATAAGCRPFPRDPMFVAAEFAARPLAQLLEHHRTRIVRTHEQLPFHRLREVDNRSLTWLARQPGRSVREKLSGRTHALGVKRDLTADTAENRLVRAFAHLIVQKGGERLAHARAYDQGAADLERAGRLAETVQLCDERMRRSALAEVPAVARMRPNNVLLSDPVYSRVFRAWRWVRDAEQDLQHAWREVPGRIRVLLFWLVAARLASTRRVLLWDTLARVSVARDGASFGIEVLGQDGGVAVWRTEPGLELLISPAGPRERPFLVRLSLQGEFLFAQVSTLEGRGLLRGAGVAPLSFEVKPAAEPLAPGRGIPLVVDGLEVSIRGANRNYADLEGLRALADMIFHTILARCDERRPLARLPVGSSTPLPEDARVGIELASSRLRVSDGQTKLLAVRGWTAAHQLPGDGGRAEWLDGRSDRALAHGLSGRQIWSLGDALDPEPDDEPGALSLATRRMVDALAHELDRPASVRAGYAVPDSIDAFSQRTLRAVMSTAFGKAVPVWRSVAAAMAWQLSPQFRERGVRPGDHVVVADMESSSVVLTLLVARRDGKLERDYPASSGLYWERKPPVPPNEGLMLSGWQRVLRDYATALVVKALGDSQDLIRPEEQRRIVGDLVRTGTLSELVERGGSGSVFVRTHGAQGEAVVAIELSHDDRSFRAEVERWLQRVADAVGPEFKTLAAPRGSRTHLVLAGGPCALPWFVTDGVPGLRSKLQRWGEARIFSVPSSGIAAGARDCLLRVDAGCLAWREWLPDLSLEVVHDGHYGELPLIDRDTLVDPFLGEALSIDVPETLLLARGKEWYSFPLIEGRENRRPLAWEARLESPAFPLDRDIRATLKLSYNYGLENSYQLAIEPQSLAEASFSRVEARWIRGGGASMTAAQQEAPVLPSGDWNQKEAAKFVEAASLVTRPGGERSLNLLFALTKVCWSQGRSLATAPADVKAAFGPLVDRLLRDIPREGVDPQRVPRALEILSLCHEDAPTGVGTLVLELDGVVGDDAQAYKKTAFMLSTLAGDAAGGRRVFLDRLLERLRRHTALETFDLSMISTTMGAFGNAAWRHPGFVSELGHNGDGVQLLIGQCRRTLQNLLARVPLDVSNNEERESVSKRFGRPFRDACELLLALLRLRETEVGTALRCGTASADAFAKVVRQLDARLARCGVKLNWRVRIKVQVPDSLHRMSPVAFALNACLSEGAGSNLVHVTGAETD